MTRIALVIHHFALVAAAASLAPVQAQTQAVDGVSAGVSGWVATANAERTGVQFHDADGALWIRGTSYKARADSNGLTYIPFLGSSAPRTWPVRFALTEVTVGGRAIPLMHGDVARSGTRVTIDRGSVVVRYDLESNSVEQSFVVAGVAGTAGDLVLRVALVTDLTVTSEGRGHSFLGPDGGVAFGAATVLDQAGRSLAIETQTEEGHLIFRVPAHFLAEAEGNVIIDPLITSLTIDEFGADLTEPDVAFELTGNTYCVVYEESFAATDVDIYWRTLDAATFAILDQGYIDLSTGRSTRPRIASNAQSDTFLVAFAREDASGRKDVYARMRPSAGGAVWAAEFPLTSFDPLFTRVAHDIGGDAREGAGTSNYLVVWEKRGVNGGPVGSDIQGCLIGASGVLAPGYIDLTASQAGRNQGPAISKCTGDPSAHGAWWIVYTDEDSAAAKCQVRGTRIAVDGTITDADRSLWSIQGTTAIRNAAVSSPYANAHAETVHVAFDYDLVAGGTRSDLISIGRSGAVEVLSSTGIDLVDVSDAGSNERAALATLADRAVLLYIDKGKPTASFDLLASSLEFVRGGEVAVGERRMVLATYPLGYSASARAVSRASGGDRMSRRVFVVWENMDIGPGGINVYGALLDFPEPMAIGGNVCRGVKNSTGDHGYLTAFGDNAMSTPKTLRATRLPADALGYFLAGPARAAFTPPASEGLLCVGGSIGRYVGSILNSGPMGRFDFVIDPTAIVQPTGTVAASAGETWYFQAWHRDANPASTSNFTNAVAVRF